MKSRKMSFDEYYSESFGARWSALRDALLEKEIQVRRWNAFAVPSPVHTEWQGLLGCSEFNGEDIERGENNLFTSYVMDPASVVAARSLEIASGDRILDMCAAPGGKTLILAEAIAEEGNLLACEISQPRRERLVKVIQQYVPRPIRERIRVSGMDAGRLAARERESFEKILLDAPCSGERHLLQNKSEFSKWTVGRTEKLAQRQYALLTAAIEALVPGGRVLYSTCALSPLENDGVIERVLEKKSEKIRLVEISPSLQPEKTKYGFQFLPDQCQFGPIYFTCLEKLD